MDSSNLSLPIYELLQPTLSLEEGLALLQEHKFSLTPTLSGHLSRCAHEFISVNNLNTAEKLYRWAVAAGELLGHRQATAFCSYDLAELLENMENHLSAIQFYRKALLHYHDIGDIQEVGRIFYRITICYEKRGLAEKAIATLKEADKALSQGGIEHSAKVNFYPLLSELLIKHDQSDEAHYVEEVFQTAKKRLDRAESVRPIFEKAMLLSREGKLNEALSLMQEVEAVLMIYSDRRDQASYLLNIGGMLSDAAKYSEATAKLKRSAVIFIATGNKEGEAKACKNLASNFEDQGYYQAALDEYRHSLDLFEELGDSEAVGRAMNELGVIHKNLNLFMDALRYYIGAREIFREADRSESLRGLLGNLDTLFSKLRLRFSPWLAEKARDLFERGEFVEMAKLLEIGILPWETRSHVSDIPSLASPEFSRTVVEPVTRGGESLLALARSYLASGKIRPAVQEMWAAASTFQVAKRYDQASDLFYEVGGICEAYGLCHDLIHIGQQLGNCLIQADRLNEAREVLEETVQESEERDLFPVLWQARLELAQVYRRLKDSQKAMTQFSRATEELEKRVMTFKHVTKAEGFFGDKIILYQRYVDLLIETGDVQGAYELVLRAKSWPFVTFSKHVREAGPTKLSEKLQEQLEYARQTAHDFIEGEKNETVTKTGQWLLDCDELRIWTEACEENWKLPSRASHELVTLSSINQHLDEKSAIVDFFFTESTLYVFVVTDRDLRCFPMDITKEEIFQKISEVGFVHMVRQYRGLYAIPQIHALLKEWFEPCFRTILADQNLLQVCFCLHGILHLLPVAVAMPRFPSTEIVSWYVPHASFFNYSDLPLGSTDFRYLGVGVLDLDLQKTGAEITDASKYFDKAKRCVIVDRQVSPSTVLAEMQFSDVIHFACHGMIRDDIPELSYLALGRDDRLRAVDILSRGHTKAKLVILSACSTSVGRVAPSDEIVSLARSFLYIGAEAVLATLWPIPDSQTKDFINDFYHLWVGEQKPLRIAFNIAQRMHSDNPIVWSAFVLLEAANKVSTST